MKAFRGGATCMPDDIDFVARPRKAKTVTPEPTFLIYTKPQKAEPLLWPVQ